jgi:hypothetical protein
MNFTRFSISLWITFLSASPAYSDFQNSQHPTNSVILQTPDTNGHLPAPRPSLPPVATSVAGLSKPSLSLDGEWQATAPPAVGPETFDPSTARSVMVPGQWRQQGLIDNKEDGASVQRSFFVPQEWKGHRIRLRFESIHGNCRYWVNGASVGQSTRLFTPVDLDITDAVRFGAENELHIAMELDSAAETLSHMSEYAQHSLLGIDRSIKLFARASKLNFDWATLRSEAHTIDFRGGHERHIRPALSQSGVDAFINMDDPATTLETGKHYQASLNLRFQ